MDVQRIQNMSAITMATNSTCFQFVPVSVAMAMEFNSMIASLTVGLAVVISILSVITVLSNGLIIYTVWRSPSLQTPSTILLCNLAFSDLAVGVVPQPLFVITKSLHSFHGNLEDTCWLFLVSSISSAYFAAVSFCGISAASVDRWLALCLHMRYPQLITPRRVSCFCAVVWFINMAVMVLALINQTIYYSVTIVAMVTLMGLIVVSYVKIYRILRHHQKAIHDISTSHEHGHLNMTNYTRTVVTVFYVFVVFVLCYAPYMCVMFIILSGSSDEETALAAMFVSVTLVFANSSLNPALYFWRVTAIRHALRATVGGIVGRFTSNDPKTTAVATTIAAGHENAKSKQSASRAV